MARSLGAANLERANISIAAIPSAIKKLNRRLDELNDLHPPAEGLDIYGVAQLVSNKVNATIDEVFGVGTADQRDFSIHHDWFTPSYGPTDWSQKIEYFIRARSRAISVIQAAIKFLEEKGIDADDEAGLRVLRAYDGLELHPEIARAASDLYRNGHYANAIEDAVKALNALVRLRSGEEGDGTSLMQGVFSPKSPILRFNELKDQSDNNEQTGFMMLFSGAVAGLRNPRAHALIKDDPERALEFIAFVSLLAKLLDGAKKSPGMGG